MRLLATDTHVFPSIWKDGKIDVNKTMFMHRLISDPNSKIFFISRPRRFGILFGIILAAVAAAAEQVEVRVRQTPGGPQIFVDGKPVPPHMFWGREIIANQPVSGEWRPFKIAHTPAVTVEKSEVRFAYQPVTGSVEVRNFTFGSASNLAWRIDRKATDKTMWKSVPAGRRTAKSS